MSASVAQDDDSTDEQINIEYGDEFRHIITDEVRTVHDARPNERKVIWCNGGWDERSELVAAIKGETSLYEVEARGSDTYTPDEY